jgi:FtsH-binding integral membrane protein
MARSNKPLRLITMFAVIFMVLIGVVGLVAVVGPNWVGNYVLTAIVVVGVVFVTVSATVWVVKRLPNPPYRDWWQ